MNKEESLALYEQGRDAWNAWAEKMLAERAELEKSGQWKVEKEAWKEAAKVDFREHVFERNVDFSSHVFPDFANFHAASFSGYAVFDKASFSGYAVFDKASFSGYATFLGASFSGKAVFTGASFSGITVFTGASFSGIAGFIEASFSEGAWFTGASFSGEAFFGQAVFMGVSNFQNVEFNGDAIFAAMKGESVFTLQGAFFLFVPDFEQAHFAEAPRLDIAPPPQSKGWFPKTDRPDLTARWRALKRLAIQGHDHQRELMFFAEELKAARGVRDKAWPTPRNLLLKNEPVWPGGVRYWSGILYQAFSDFGRSMLRPLLWWCASTIGFLFIYLSGHFAVHSPTYSTGMVESLWRSVVGGFDQAQAPPALSCIAGSGDPWDAATYLSVIKGSIVFGRFDTEKLKQTYACLYGENSFPDAVAYWGLGQSVFSAVLIFLLLLAVRNHFRIK
ncbi:MAG: pentapeptide repeat-containing protein [Rhodospirillales bacterium]|nr:pentapeptide repeat-containing protein [Rhodospirillales bacterium]